MGLMVREFALQGTMRDSEGEIIGAGDMLSFVAIYNTENCTEEQVLFDIELFRLGGADLNNFVAGKVLIMRLSEWEKLDSMIRNAYEVTAKQEMAAGSGQPQPETADTAGTKTVSVYAHPYANITGEIAVPDDIEAEEMMRYIDDHFNDVSFDISRVALDFSGTEYEVCDGDIEYSSDEMLR